MTRFMGQLYLPDVLESLITKYRFVEYPQKLSQPGSSITFKHGKFDNIAIDSFEIYDDGIAVSSNSNSKIIDDFIIEFTKWIKDEFGVDTYIAHTINKNYDSNIIFSSDRSPLKALERIDEFSTHISTVLKKTNGMDHKFTPFGISFAPNELVSDFLMPSPFRIERKVGADSSLHQYISSAPLPTDDHINAIELLETLL